MREPLGFEDHETMWRDELRPTRLSAEFLAAELMMTDHNIGSTVVIFGSARVREGDELSRYLGLAEETARLFTQVSESRFKGSDDELREYVVCTGGGPGIMEAANKGAIKAGGLSVGLNIELPSEQVKNPYLTEGLDLKFHYFALRKMHLMMRAKGLIVFPGGYGTLDELFEALTLVQTRKVPRIPIVMFGRSYWEKVINFSHLVDCGTIDANDVDLITYVETPEQAFECVCAAQSPA